MEKKPIWQIAQEEKNKVKGLLMMLANYPLDPTFINYGNFYGKIKGRSYHPSSRKAALKQEKEGVYKFSGNFFDVSYSFNFETKNEKEIKTLIAAIEKNKESKAFKEAFLQRFNAIKFTKTIYLNDIEMKKLGRGFGDWYITNDIGPVLDIKEIDKAPALLEELKIKELKQPPNVSDKNPEFEIEYIERHYLDEEWDEIRELFKEHKTVAYQFSRITEKRTAKELKEYKEITFKATGRKVLAKFTKYTMLYIEK